MRLVIVSNRLPVTLDCTADTVTVQPGSGGLVTALAPVLRRFGGAWIGWPGSDATDADRVDPALVAVGADFGYEIVPVHLAKEELRGFYHGFSNEIIWPLFHDLQTRCNFVPEYWKTYTQVVAKFAAVVERELRANDVVWIHDYQLIGLGERLKGNDPTGRLGFFLHIPFPPPDLFAKLPWRGDVLESLLAYDLVGFQTPHDLENFVDCIRRLLPRVRAKRRPGGIYDIHLLSRSCRAGAFPIGIDFDEFATRAASPEVTARTQALRSAFPDQQLLIGVDRLDYTKGIPYRLRAFQHALRHHPELHRKVALMQFVVPSREAVPEYQELRSEIERLVTQVNGEFTQAGWVPIHHMFRSIDRDELLACYRAADVGLVTPLKDGMNLVAKEYCAAQVDGNGVLILSEFAGAAHQFRHDAMLVNPYNIEHVAGAIRSAVAMPLRKRRPAMKRLRRIVRDEDVYAWVRSFLPTMGFAIDSLTAGRPRNLGVSLRGEQTGEVA